jgi:hypothetical protein
MATTNDNKPNGAKSTGLRPATPGSPKRRAPEDDSVTRTCGVVMPISSIDGCTETHWAEVKAVLWDAIDSAGFVPKLVSDADDSGVIQRRIIQNLYTNDIILCDVSGKNPNVMFELGMRLAFDKPAVIVKDDKTEYSFDTSPIEHVGYRRDLRYSDTVKFKSTLAGKLASTYKAARDDATHSVFLRHFGSFTAAGLNVREGTKEDLILQRLDDIELRMRSESVRAMHGAPGSSSSARAQMRSFVDECIQKKLFSVDDLTSEDAREALVHEALASKTISWQKYFSRPRDLVQCAREVCEELLEEELEAGMDYNYAQ